jgi:sec-independent protein translocase protein TatA
MFRNLGAPEIILILVVLVLLFGARRLPDAARSLGRSMRIFKSEVKEMRGEDDRSAEPERPREVEGRVVEPSTKLDETQRVSSPEQADRDR